MNSVYSLPYEDGIFDMVVSTLSFHHWNAFQDYLHDKKLARNTLNQYAYPVKAYHKMYNEDIAIKRLEPNNTIPHYFDEDDIIKIFIVCRNIKHLAI